jgi:uroporphyrinogen decarboxylase
MFRKFVTPYLAKVVAGIHEAGGFAVKHTDGDIMPILDQLAESGIDGLHSLDPMAGVDIAEVKRLYGDRVCLLGNVDCSKVQAGTKEEVRASAQYCLTHGGVSQGGYIFTTSNCIFAGVPIVNYEEMLRVREEMSG